MKDRYGLEYQEVLDIQRQHLAIWGERLQPKIHAEVTEYVLATNVPAETPEGKHRVYRGGDLSHIIQTWPNINTYIYAPKPSTAEAMI